MNVKTELSMMAKGLYQAGHRKAAEKLQKISNGMPKDGGWISVEDRYPDKSDDTDGRLFIVIAKGRKQPSAAWWHEYPLKWCFQCCISNNDEGMCGFEVTHWMPLPVPPVNNNTHSHQPDDKTSQTND